MKIRMTISGLIVALAAVPTVMAWYTGQQVEAFVTQSIEDGNVELRTLGKKWGVTPVIELMSFERGVFSSTVRYRVKIGVAAQHGNQPAEEGKSFELVDNLWHGPFPLSNLASGRLAPAMVAGRVQLMPTPMVNDWFAATQGAAPLAGAYSVSYDKQVDSSLNLASFEASNDGRKLTFAGLAADVSYDIDTRHGVLALESDGFALAGPKQGNDIDAMAVKGITANIDLTPGKSDIALGSQMLALKEWTFISRTNPLVTLRDTGIGLELTEADTGVSAKMALDVGMLSFRGTDVAGLKLAVGMKHMDPKAVKALSDVMDARSRRTGLAFFELEGGGSPAMEHEASEEQQILKANLQALLAGNPILSVSPFQLRTASGTSTFDLNVALAKPTLTDSPLDLDIFRPVGKLDAKLVLSRTNLVELLAIALQQEGDTVDSAAPTARMIVENFSEQVVKKGLAKMEGNNIVSTLNYAGGQVDLNGNKMSRLQFVMMVLSAAKDSEL
ncbi:YdgA family protein [Achromobacter xylosoxidans]|uniref:YdgA family protein n=1 Tax=Alcaligenes xylosoxydans xylosoxydans TaxID=85698 RepID=UPI001F138C3B|nr:YdgA family protein [Achromobacter xylosoxidans]